MDENTVITDYWLDFVAARVGIDTPSQAQTQIVAEGLHERMQDFGHSIESLLEGSRKLQLELEKITCTKQSFSERIPDWGSTNISLQDSMQILGAAPLPARQLSAGEEDHSSACRQRSIADRFRSSFLYTKIQKLL